MREIKFRAWDTRNNEMVYSDKDDCFYINTKGAMFMYGIPNTEGELYHLDYSLMQYTGLKDKNGKEIFEGDICKKKENEPTVIEFFKCEGSSGEIIMGFDMPSAFTGDMEVIGNIYENKDLLP